MSEFLSKYLPINSALGVEDIDIMMGYVHWLMLILFVGWGIFFIVTLIKFNSKSNPKANYHGVTNHYSTYAEVAVVLCEVALLIGFAIPLWANFKTDLPNASDTIEVRVIGQQFAWNIHYPGEDGIFGVTKPELVDEETNPIGLSREGYGADDITTINQLHLPVNKEAMLYLRSKDVIHSFSLPEMRVKQDLIPGMEIPIFFTPSMTSKDFLTLIKGTERDKPEIGMGGYEIACAQLCGNSHYRMKGYLTVETEDEFNAWLKAQAEELLELEDEDDEW